MTISFATLTPAALDEVLANPAPPALRQPEAAAAFRALALAQLNAVPRPMAWIMAIDGRPAAGFGTVLHWAGRAEGWMVLTAGLPRRARVAAAREARARMDELQAHPWWRRIEMTVQADEPWAASFARALGMRLEGIARGWGPDGRDFMMFGRIAGECG